MRRGKSAWHESKANLLVFNVISAIRSCVILAVHDIRCVLFTLRNDLFRRLAVWMKVLCGQCQANPSQTEPSRNCG